MRFARPYVVVRVIGRHRSGVTITSAPNALSSFTFSIDILSGHREHAAVLRGSPPPSRARRRCCPTCLDDGAARLELSLALGGLDDRDADAVLDAARPGSSARTSRAPGCGCPSVTLWSRTSGVLPMQSSTRSLIAGSGRSALAIVRGGWYRRYDSTANGLNPDYSMKSTRAQPELSRPIASLLVAHGTQRAYPLSLLAPRARTRRSAGHSVADHAGWASIDPSRFVRDRNLRLAFMNNPGWGRG